MTLKSGFILNPEEVCMLTIDPMHYIPFQSNELDQIETGICCTKPKEKIMKCKAIYTITAPILLTVLAQLSWGAGSTPLLNLRDANALKPKASPFFPKETNLSGSGNVIQKTFSKPSSQNLAPNLNSTLQSGGGADTGAGGPLGSAKVYPYEIADLLKRSKAPSVYILRSLEAIFSFGDQMDGPYSSAAKKLFGGEKTIYEALQEVQFEAREHGPCFGKNKKGEDVPAPASAINSPHICFSLELLANLLDKEKVQSEILALVIHEVSHTLGTSEIEAYLLQNLVKSSLTNDPYDKIQKLVEAYRSDAKNTLIDVTYLLEKFSQLNPQDVCMGVSRLPQMINDLLQRNMKSLGDSEKNGISFLAPPEISSLQGTLIKSINAMTYCTTTNPAYQNMIEAFGNKSEISLLDFQAALFPGQKMSKVPNWTIHRLDSKNESALKLELSDMKSALTDILNNL